MAGDLRPSLPDAATDLNASQRHVPFFPRPGTDLIATIRLASIGAFMLIGVLAAVAARIASAVRDRHVADSGFHDRAITFHALVMMFLVVAPGIPFALGPLPCPSPSNGVHRTTRYSDWTSLGFYWSGAVVLIVSALAGRFEHGLLYVLSYRTGHSAAVIGLAVGIFMVGLACAIHGFRTWAAARDIRARIVTQCDISTLAVTLFLSSLLQAAVLPVQGWTVTLMLVDRFKLSRASALGELVSTNLLLKLFWFYAQPAFLASLVAVVGSITYLIQRVGIPSMHRSHLVERSVLAFSIISLSTWGIHLVGVGQSPLMSTLFSAFNIALVVPLSIPFACWLSALRHASRRNDAEIAVALNTMLLLAIGVLSILPIANLATSPSLRAVYFGQGLVHFAGGAVCVIVVFLRTSRVDSSLIVRIYRGKWPRAAVVLVSAGLWSMLAITSIQRTGSVFLVDERPTSVSIGLNRPRNMATLVASLGFILQVGNAVFKPRKATEHSDIRKTKPMLEDT